MHLKEVSEDYILKGNWFEYRHDNKKYIVDWNKTVAYMAAPGSYGVNINLERRQYQGIVKQFEYDEVCKKVIEQLKLVKNPINNKLLFKEVVKSSEIFDGNFTHSAADIILIPENWGIMVHHNITNGELFSYNPEQKGMHSMNGIFLMYGKKIMNLRHKQPKDLRDIAPSILDLFDVPIPSYMEGTSIFLLQEKKDTNIRFEAVDTHASYSDEEQGEIEERLKKLGYL